MQLQDVELSDKPIYSPENPRLCTGPKGKKDLIIDLGTKSELRVKDIAQISQTSPANVCTILKRYNLSQNHVDDYKSQRAEIMAGIQSEYAKKLIEPDKLDKAGLGEISSALQRLHSVERLERGLSTSNVAVQMSDDELAGELEALNSRLERLQAIDITPTEGQNEQM